MTIDDNDNKPDEKEPVSIHDSLLEAIEEVGEETPERPAPPPRKPVREQDERGRDELAEGIERDPRPRDEQGRFIKADGSLDEEAEAKRQPRARAEAEARQPEQQQPAPREENRDQRLARMTANWRAEQKQFLAQQPPEVQDFLIARDQEMGAAYTRKTQRLATLENEYGPIHQMLEPDLPALRAAGFTPRLLIEGWANAERALLRGPESAATMLRNVAEGYQVPRELIAYTFGFDPRTPQEIAAGMGQQQQQQPGYYDPRVDQLLAERQAEQEQAALYQHNQAQAAANQAMAQIQEFRDATDRQGNLLHPYFTEVENHMVALADHYIRTAGKVPPLQQLYDDAVGANPETRARMLADVQATQSERQRAQQAARGKTEKARKASLSVVGAGSGRPNNRTLENGALPRGSSIRAHLDRAIEQVGDAD